MRVVVGAGIAGASVAYHASRLGADTVLVDRDTPGQATSAGAGIVCPWSSKVADPTWQRLADAAAEYYPTLVADLGTDTGYRQVGALRLVRSDAEQQEVLDRCAGSPGEVSVLSGESARDLFPPLRGDLAAVHISGGARVDGRRLRAALREAAVRQGAKVLSGTARLIAAGSRITGVDVDGSRIDADTVVVAAGAWSPAVLDPIGVRIAVAPQRGQIVHLGLSGVDTSWWPVVLPPSSHYLLAFDDQRVVVGATRETGAGFDHRVTAAGQAEVLREALSVAPGLADATVLETRIGFRPAGPDILPLLGAVPGWDGLVVANGLGASGLTLGPHVGRLAAAVALHEDPGVDLSPFDPLRH
ncbi:MAG TPA: FAD-dependent oxidoreductase [Pseudonocardiaceae bacterium]|nr:FAD-dependent oxidoreductase [Pseudonocardiaceae bacterium]